MFWEAKYLADTTAGLYWSGNSWWYFFEDGGHQFFVWRPWWGGRLVIDLTGGGLCRRYQALADAMVAEERRGVYDHLLRLSPQVAGLAAALAGHRAGEDGSDQPRFTLDVGRVTAALHLAGVHRIPECVPFLRQWEEADWTRSWTGTAALGFSWWAGVQLVRPVAQHSLRRLDVEPEGYAAYHFVRNFDGPRLEIPEKLPDRVEQLKRLRRGMSGRGVLNAVGAPDFISRPSGRELWRYYLRGPEGWRALIVGWTDALIGQWVTSIREGPADFEGIEPELLGR